MKDNPSNNVFEMFSIAVLSFGLTVYSTASLFFARLLLDPELASFALPSALLGGVSGMVLFYLFAKTKKKLFTTLETPLMTAGSFMFLLIISPLLLIKLPYEYSKLKLITLFLMHLPAGAIVLLLFLLERSRASSALFSVLAGCALSLIFTGLAGPSLLHARTFFLSSLLAMAAFYFLFPSLSVAFLSARRIKKSKPYLVSRIRLMLAPFVISGALLTIANEISDFAKLELRFSASSKAGAMTRSSPAGYIPHFIDISPSNAVTALEKKDNSSDIIVFFNSRFITSRDSGQEDPLLAFLATLAGRANAGAPAGRPVSGPRFLVFPLGAAYEIRHLLGQDSIILESCARTIKFFQDFLSFPSTSTGIRIAGHVEGIVAEIMKLGPDSFDFFYSDVTFLSSEASLLSLDGLRILEARMNRRGLIAIRTGSSTEAARVALALALLAEEKHIFIDEIASRLKIIRASSTGNPFMVLWPGRDFPGEIIHDAARHSGAEILTAQSASIKPLMEILTSAATIKEIINNNPAYKPACRVTDILSDESHRIAENLTSSSSFALVLLILLTIALTVLELHYPDGLKTRASLARFLAVSAIHGFLISFLFGPFLFNGPWSASRTVAGLICFIAGSYFTGTVLEGPPSTLLYSTALAAFITGHTGSFVWPPSGGDVSLPFGLMLVFSTLMLTSFNFSLTIRLLSHLHPVQFLWVITTFTASLSTGVLLFPALVAAFGKDMTLLSGLLLYTILFYYFYTVRDFVLLEIPEEDEAVSG